MQKTIAIALLVLFASTSEVGQFLKLPMLVSHYVDHYTEEGQNVAAFFHEHYVHHHGSDNKDQNEDNKLPFKTTIVGQVSVAYLLPVFEIVNSTTILPWEKKSNLPSAFVLTTYLKDIFHPPQIV